MRAFHVEPRPITRINTCFDTFNAHITTNYGRIAFVFLLHNQSYSHRILVTISAYAGVHTMLRTQPNSCWKADKPQPMRLDHQPPHSTYARPSLYHFVHGIYLVTTRYNTGPFPRIQIIKTNPDHPSIVPSPPIRTKS
jgi:hypothetical protein